jgi:hypothetical protein
MGRVVVLIEVNIIFHEPGSSGSIVSHYRLGEEPG